MIRIIFGLGLLCAFAASANAQTGVFGPVVGWPLVGLHAGVLPDGRVISYGSDGSGNQGVTIWDIWDPACGTDDNCHMVLPNSGSDWFCTGGFLLPDGEWEMVGGDLRFSGQTNTGIVDARRIDPVTQAQAPDTSMMFPRWYPTAIALPNQTWAVFGGSLNIPATPSITPELYDPNSRSWAQLWGATSDAAFGNNNASNWWYPRGTVIPGTAHIGFVTYDGLLFDVDPTGQGAITQLSGGVPPGLRVYPTISYAPGQMMSVRAGQIISLIDFTQNPPAVSGAGYTAEEKTWSNLTQLANGQVLLTGGESGDGLTPAYDAWIWDAGTGQWTQTGSASVHRAYHSTDLLLPDATVLDMAGGATPILDYSNLNAQIYYPPYLFNADGTPAVRPVLTNTPAIATTGSQICGNTDSQLGYNAGWPAQNPGGVLGVSIVRLGSSTHSNNTDQRWFSLSFNQNGGPGTWCAWIPGDTTMVIPGNYMVFVWNAAGVPSIAQITRIDP